jgi:hypothetical protein
MFGIIFDVEYLGHPLFSSATPPLDVKTPKRCPVT